MIVKLTARSVSALGPVVRDGQLRRAEYFDADRPGLSLRVTPNGAKSWCVSYRYRGRVRRLTLGTLKKLTLAEARDRARNALRDAADGKDPGRPKREAARAPTLGTLVTRYIEEHAKPKKRTWKQDQRLLRNVILPALGEQTAVADVTRADVRQLVKGVAQRAPVQANRALALLSRVFRFAVEEDIIHGSPVVHISRPTRESARERVLTDDEVRGFWAATEALALPLRAFWRLRLLTAQRGGEVRDMRWADVDLSTGWWSLSAEQTKNKRAHRVPLNDLAVECLQEVKAHQQAILDAREKRGDDTSKALDLVLAEARGARQHRESAATFGIQDFKGHDLRRTAATRMREAGVPRADVSLVLNHVEGGPAATRVYDRYDGDAEKRRALGVWAERLRGILGDHR